MSTPNPELVEPTQLKQPQHSTKTLAIRGVLFNWMGRGCSFAITFVATPIILGALGNEAYGLWAIVMSVGSYYALADLGMQSACTKFIAEFEAKGDRDATNRLFSTAILVYSVSAGVLLILTAPVAWFFPLLFEVQEQSISEIRWTVFLIGLSVAIRLQAQVFGSTIRALKRFDIANVIAVVIQVLQAGFMIWVVVAGHGLLGMAWVMVLTTLVGRVAEGIVANKLLGGFQSSLWVFDRESFSILFRFSSWNVLKMLARLFNRKSAPFIIGYLLGPASVPFYALASSLIGKAQSLVGGVAGVVMPLASQLDAEQRPDALIHLATLSARLLLTLGGTVASIAWFMGGNFIELWLGEGYRGPVEPVLHILGFVFATDMISGGMRDVLTGINRVDAVFKLHVTAAAVTVPFGILMVYHLGVIGMAWSLLLSSLIVNGILCPYVTCRITGYSWRLYMKRVLIRPIVALVPGILVAATLNEWFPPSNIIDWFLVAGCSATVTALTAFFACIDRSLQQSVLNSLRLRPRQSKSTAS